MDKKNIIIICLSILIVVLSVILVTLIYHKEKTPIVLDGKYNVLDLEKCVNSACDETFQFLDNELNVKKRSDGGYEINYNDFVIFASADKPYIGDKIFTFEDSLLFTVKDDEGNLKLMMYTPGSFTSEKIIVGDDDYWYIKSVDSKDNKLIIKVSRFVRGDEFIEIENEAPVEINECHFYEQFRDREAERKYEIEYSNGKFNEVKLVSTSKLSKLKKYSALCK